MTRRIPARFKPPGSRRKKRVLRIRHPLTITYWTESGQEIPLDMADATMVLTGKSSWGVKVTLSPELYAALLQP